MPKSKRIKLTHPDSSSTNAPKHGQQSSTSSSPIPTRHINTSNSTNANGIADFQTPSLDNNSLSHSGIMNDKFNDFLSVQG